MRIGIMELSAELAQLAALEVGAGVGALAIQRNDHPADGAHTLFAVQRQEMLALVMLHIEYNSSVFYISYSVR